MWCMKSLRLFPSLERASIFSVVTTGQDPRSLADQEAYYRRWLAEHVSVPWRLEIIASQGSGENLERVEYLSLEPVMHFDCGF